MMSALPHMPMQSGLTAILAALGPATQANGEDGGFEQLLAKLPIATGTATVPTAATAVGEQAVPTAATPIQLPLAQAAAAPTAPAIDLPIAPTLPLAANDAPVDAVQVAAPKAMLPTEVDVPAEPVIKTPVAAPKAAKTENSDDAAAAAASLLIAVASPRAAAKPVAEKAAPTVSAETEDTAESETATETPAAPVAAQAPVAPDPIAASVIVQVAAKPAANKPAAGDQPVADEPAADKAAKPLFTAAAPRRTESSVPTPPAAPAPAVAKTTDAAQPLPIAPAAAEPKAVRPTVDGGASMAVLFAQPDIQGAATLAAAKAAPVIERTLDTTSDDQWIAQLAADIAATKSDNGGISFRLMPRHLGRLDVSMLSGDDGVSLKLDTQHEATATIVNAAQPRLVEDLRQQGVRVAGAEVTCTPGETGRQSQQGQGQGRTAHADASHLIETANDRANQRGDSPNNERTADRRGRFA